MSTDSTSTDSMSTGSTSTDSGRPVRRVTKQRIAIGELLKRADAFKSAQTLHAELRAGGDTAGLATVYRTLQSMVELGEVDAIRSDDGEMVYRRCESTGHHHHLVCRTCGRTVEIEGKVVERWAAQVAQEHGFRDAGHELELFGLCSDC